MPKVVIRSSADAPRVDQHCGLEMRGGVVHHVLSNAPGGLEARLIKLTASDTVQWAATAQGLVVYVLSGAVLIQGIPVGEDGAIILEHGAAAECICLQQSTQLIVFKRSEEHAEKPMRAGSHVHILPPQAVPRSRHNMAPEGSIDGRDFIGGSLYSDAACASCELWLHGNSFSAHYQAELHSHSEDEVIFVTRGSMFLGNKSFGAGTAIAIAKNTIYGFRSGELGLAFVNFRPKSPTYMLAKRIAAPLDERATFLAHMSRPAYK